MDQSKIEAGYSVYTPTSLKLYDLVVHGISNRWLWRCPTEALVRLHSENVSAKHLDVGVATGIFLDRADWPVENPEIHLMDPNTHCLNAAAKRLFRFAPKTLNGDVFKPFPTEERFLSVSLGYLLHCLPGAMTEKAPIVFKNVGSVMEPNGIVFGATLLQGDAPRNFAARKLMDIYNKKGVFSNVSDTYEHLLASLNASFDDVTIERLGCAALFKARKRK